MICAKDILCMVDELPAFPIYFEIPPKIGEFSQILIDLSPNDGARVLRNVEVLEVQQTICNFTAKRSEQLTFKEGDLLCVIKKLGQWIYCQNEYSHQEGLVSFAAFSRKAHIGRILHAK